MSKKGKLKKGISSKFGSSNVADMSYDRESGTMQLQFVHGGVYEYSDVEPSTVTAFRRAKSKGRFVNSAIVDQYETTRLK